MESAWRDVAVTTGSLDQAVHVRRKTLVQPGEAPIIETETRRGYGFLAQVSRVQRRESDAGIDTVLETHRAWIEGRVALETLKCDAIVGARAAFERVIARAPTQAAAHVGLENACALQFEMTRTDARRGAALDARADRAGTRRCRTRPTCSCVSCKRKRAATSMRGMRREYVVCDWRNEMAPERR